MFLVDTNVWLEVLLDQQRATEAASFLRNSEPSQLALTDFSLFSIGIILCRLKREQVFDTFLLDVVFQSEIKVLHLDLDHLKKLTLFIRDYKLDFDDAYQHLAAEMYGCTIVSFDEDFDRTPLGRKQPGQVA